VSVAPSFDHSRLVVVGLFGAGERESLVVDSLDEAV
jgi:hypothetical protein